MAIKIDNHKKVTWDYKRNRLIEKIKQKLIIKRISTWATISSLFSNYLPISSPEIKFCFKYDTNIFIIQTLIKKSRYISFHHNVIRLYSKNKNFKYCKNESNNLHKIYLKRYNFQISIDLSKLYFKPNKFQEQLNKPPNPSNNISLFCIKSGIFEKIHNLENYKIISNQQKQYLLTLSPKLVLEIRNIIIKTLTSDIKNFFSLILSNTQSHLLVNHLHENSYKTKYCLHIKYSYHFFSHLNDNCLERNIIEIKNFSLAIAKFNPTLCKKNNHYDFDLHTKLCFSNAKKIITYKHTKANYTIHSHLQKYNIHKYNIHINIKKLEIHFKLSNHLRNYVINITPNIICWRYCFIRICKYHFISYQYYHEPNKCIIVLKPFWHLAKIALLRSPFQNLKLEKEIICNKNKFTSNHKLSYKPVFIHQNKYNYYKFSKPLKTLKLSYKVYDIKNIASKFFKTSQFTFIQSNKKFIILEHTNKRLYTTCCYKIRTNKTGIIKFNFSQKFEIIFPKREFYKNCTITFKPVISNIIFKFKYYIDFKGKNFVISCNKSDLYRYKLSITQISFYFALPPKVFFYNETIGLLIPILSYKMLVPKFYKISSILAFNKITKLIYIFELYKCNFLSRIRISKNLLLFLCTISDDYKYILELDHKRNLSKHKKEKAVSIKKFLNFVSPNFKILKKILSFTLIYSFVSRQNIFPTKYKSVPEEFINPNFYIPYKKPEKKFFQIQTYYQNLCNFKIHIHHKFPLYILVDYKEKNRSNNEIITFKLNLSSYYKEKKPKFWLLHKYYEFGLSVSFIVYSYISCYNMLLKSPLRGKRNQKMPRQFYFKSFKLGYTLPISINYIYTTVKMQIDYIYLYTYKRFDICQNKYTFDKNSQIKLLYLLNDFKTNYKISIRLFQFLNKLFIKKSLQDLFYLSTNYYSCSKKNHIPQPNNKLTISSNIIPKFYLGAQNNSNTKLIYNDSKNFSLHLKSLSTELNYRYLIKSSLHKLHIEECNIITKHFIKNLELINHQRTQVGLNNYSNLFKIYSSNSSNIFLYNLNKMTFYKFTIINNKTLSNKTEKYSFIISIYEPLNTALNIERSLNYEILTSSRKYNIYSQNYSNHLYNASLNHHKFYGVISSYLSHKKIIPKKVNYLALIKCKSKLEQSKITKMIISTDIYFPKVLTEERFKRLNKIIILPLYYTYSSKTLEKLFYNKHEYNSYSQKSRKLKLESPHWTIFYKGFRVAKINFTKDQLKLQNRISYKEYNYIQFIDRLIFKVTLSYVITYKIPNKLLNKQIIELDYKIPKVIRFYNDRGIYIKLSSRRKSITLNHISYRPNKKISKIYDKLNYFIIARFKLPRLYLGNAKVATSFSNNFTKYFYENIFLYKYSCSSLVESFTPNLRFSLSKVEYSKIPVKEILELESYYISRISLGLSLYILDLIYTPSKK